MVLELSYVNRPDMPKWPTNPEENYEGNGRIAQGSPSNASSVYHHLHTGTHVDAPWHFDDHGRTIEQIPIEDFYYTHPLVLTVRKSRGERIRREDLELYEEQLKEADIVLLYTGHSELREKDPAAFIDDFPCVDPKAALYLREEFPLLKAVAMDSISFDSAVTGDAEGYPSHHALLEVSEKTPQRTLLLFEDVNLRVLLGVKNILAICAFPVRFAGLEAAPVAMVAITGEEEAEC